jgi:hypothetical protein
VQTTAPARSATPAAVRVRARLIALGGRVLTRVWTVNGRRQQEPGLIEGD